MRKREIIERWVIHALFLMSCPGLHEGSIRGEKSRTYIGLTIPIRGESTTGRLV